MSKQELSFDAVIKAYYEIIGELTPQINSTMQVILRKILSNLEAANILIKVGFINEAKIILRSAIESVVLFCYLLEFPDKKEIYYVDSQMLEFKNSFITYKEFKNCQNDPDFQETLEPFPEEKLREENEAFFANLHPSNQSKILTELKLEKYELNDDTLQKLDNFFRNKHKKAFFQKLEDMYKELAGFKKLRFGLRDILFRYYNHDSQIAHGRLHDWIRNHSIDIEKSSYQPIFSQSIRIIMLPIIACQEKGLNVSEKNMIKLQEEANVIYKQMDGLTGNDND